MRETNDHVNIQLILVADDGLEVSISLSVNDPEGNASWAALQILNAARDLVEGEDDAFAQKNALDFTEESFR